MKAPPYQGPPRRPPVAEPLDEIYYLMAAALQEQGQVQEPTLAAPPPRSTVEPEPEVTPPPAEPEAEIVDLGEARAAREPPKPDFNAEIMGHLAPIGDIREKMEKLTREFAAANDGSVQASVSDGLTTISKAMEAVKTDFGRVAKTLRETTAAQGLALKQDLSKFGAEAKDLATAATAGNVEAQNRLLELVSGVSDQLRQVHEGQERMLQHMAAPKRIIRDAKGKAIGSVVDMNLKG